jgi:hypothetical protein
MGIIKSCCYPEEDILKTQVLTQQHRKDLTKSRNSNKLDNNKIVYQQNNYYNIHSNNCNSRNQKPRQQSSEIKVNKQYKEKSYTGTVDSTNNLFSSAHSNSRNNTNSNRFKNDNFYSFKNTNIDFLNEKEDNKSSYVLNTPIKIYDEKYYFDEKLNNPTQTKEFFKSVG